MSEMGTFRIEVEVENPTRRGDRRRVTDVLVDTGAELSSFPDEVLEALGIERYSRMRFRQANGTILERWVGPAFIHVGGSERRMTWCSASRAISSCWARDRSKG